MEQGEAFGFDIYYLSICVLPPGDNLIAVNKYNNNNNNKKTQPSFPLC
jgi:hypothetical protein